jgi:hypothetical protein
MEAGFRKRWMRSTAAILFVALLIPLSFAFAAEDPPLEEACLKMDGLIDNMLGMQISRCSPSISKRAGKYSFYFIARRSVFNDPWDRRVWLLAVVGVVGSAMTNAKEFPELRDVSIDEVLTFDMDFAKSREVLVIPATVAKRIHNDLHDGIINVDQAYDQIKFAIAE